MYGFRRPRPAPAPRHGHRDEPEYGDERSHQHGRSRSSAAAKAASPAGIWGTGSARENGSNHGRPQRSLDLRPRASRNQAGGTGEWAAGGDEGEV